MNIRTATHDDLKRIAEVHAICFPRSFSTALGSGGVVTFLDLFTKNIW